MIYQENPPASEPQASISLYTGLAAADPLALPLLKTTMDLLAQAPDLPLAHVGIITLGDVTAHHVADKARRTFLLKGRISPLDFVNANSGSPISITCTKLGLRGPTLNLTSHGKETRDLAHVLARAWLQRGHAQAMIIAESYRRTALTANMFTSLMLPDMDDPMTANCNFDLNFRST